MGPGRQENRPMARFDSEIRAHFNPELRGYASYENAMKKLLAEIPADMADRPITLVMVNSAGRFIPCAVGQRAMSLGVFHRGIAVVG
jgi:hypothetical protein